MKIKITTIDNDELFLDNDMIDGYNLVDVYSRLNGDDLTLPVTVSVEELYSAILAFKTHLDLDRDREEKLK